MNDKRRDSKGRLLHTGEVERPDGRYRYKFYDRSGKDHYVYSWRLTQSDPTPPGRKRELSLRELEHKVQMELFSGVVINGGNMTVIDLVKVYIETKISVRETTRQGYRTTVSILENEKFGHKRIDTVTTTDAKLWLIKLQREDGKSYSSIHNIRGVLRPAFQLAYEDNLIRKNPFDFELVSVVVNDSVRRESITREQERQLLQFIKNDIHFNKYYDGIFILFNTGLRISEFVGLTKQDIDFKAHKINVDHQLMRLKKKSYIEKTKTESGIRKIPMTPEVEAAFRNIIKNRPNPKVEFMVEGYTGFLFLDKNNNPMYSYHWEKYMQRIVEKYNSIYKKQMPRVTPHVCRHTFCSKMAKAGMNPKMLQYIMGHSDIGVTLNVYTHVSDEDAAQEMARVNAL